MVREAALALFMWLLFKEEKWTDSEGPTKWVTALFDRLFQSYDAMAEGVSFMRLVQGTKIKKTTISNIRKIIEGWKVTALKNIKPRIDEDNIKSYLAKLFIIHVPEARPLRIAKCVSVLLHTISFDVDVNIETFRKEVKKLKEDIENSGY